MKNIGKYVKIVSIFKKGVSLYHDKGFYRNNKAFGERLFLYRGASQDGIHLSAPSA